MNKVSIKSYIISNLSYDILSMHTDIGQFNTEAAIKLDISGEDNSKNQMQIDFKGYTDIDNPFIELSIIGTFELSDDIIDEDTEYVGKVLKEEGLSILYSKLQNCYKEIFKIANVTFPPIPDIGTMR